MAKKIIGEKSMSDEYDPFDDDEQECDGCDGEGCPLCCGQDYAPSSEECDFCKHSDECAKYVMGR
jgi:hypothetical protein